MLPLVQSWVAQLSNSPNATVGTATVEQKNSRKNSDQILGMRATLTLPQELGQPLDEARTRRRIQNTYIQR